MEKYSFRIVSGESAETTVFYAVKITRFCLQLDMSHISQKEFKTNNWLPMKERFNQRKNFIAFKHFHNQYPYYLNEVNHENLVYH